MDDIVSLWAFSTCLNSIVASSFLNEGSALASCYSKEKIEINSSIVKTLTSLPSLFFTIP